MDSGTNPPPSSDSTTDTNPVEEDELYDISNPLAPDEIFESELIDGTINIDVVRRDEEVADPLQASRTRAVPRAVSEESQTASTLDEPLAKLPIVDVHCHIHGVSLSKTKSAVDKFEKHGLFNGNDLRSEKKRQAYVKALSEYYAKGEESYTVKVVQARRFGHWNFKDDPWVAKKIINSTQRFQDATDRQDIGNPIIVTPMLLDFGYTPLGTSIASKAAKAKGSGDSMTETEARKEETADTGISYFSKSPRSEKHHRFFTRSDAAIRHQVEVLHLMAKLWPGQILPFCPFDPRRPNGLDIVKAAMDTQSYVGVKLYARCGWMPYNNAAMHGEEVGQTLDERLDEFYTYVTANDIPILNHTSPTGHPPDGALVFPWRFTAEANDTDRAAAAAFSPVGYPPAHWTKPDRYRRDRTKSQKSLEKMRYEITGFGFYCLYDQLTTSPYAWEPVLKTYPKLRLCFAHFGSKLAVYANPRYGINTQAAKEDCDLLLQKNPMVAGATGDRSFKDYFVKGAIHIRNDHKIRDDHAKESAAELLAPKTAWGDFLDKWAAEYPLDWSAKITELVTRYDNVYTDLSYLTGSGASFTDLVEPIFRDALEQRGNAGKLYEKMMIGTDWYMTEISRLAPSDFWGLVENACKMDKARYDKLPPDEQRKRTKVWDRWATKNALTYLNIKPRLSGTGMDKLVNAYGCTMDQLPPWWKTLENFYDHPEPVEPP
ncbi:MAG: hypothetical protein KF886_10390 [Candidatus Hydrogenedentes bacterium]|nr:hypothetical protein [Candidatus Hydrogenedentota bacterium]